MSKKNRNFGGSLFHIKPSVKVKVKIVKLLMYVDRKKRTGNKPKELFLPSFDRFRQGRLVLGFAN